MIDLHLAAPSSSEWLDRALAAMDEVLIDHAHCEKKAASTAINLIFRYVDRTELVVPLSRLAREELRHFEQVLAILEDRDITFGRQNPSPYAAELFKFVRRKEPDRLLDTLLCCSLIEARSCERMRLLAEHLEDEELARLYRGLLASEERHHGTYVELATSLFSDSDVEGRLAEAAKWEVEVLEKAPKIARMHT